MTLNFGRSRDNDSDRYTCCACIHLFGGLRWRGGIVRICTRSSLREMIDRYWGEFNIETQEHFYHGGGHIENRHAMVEALVFNFDLQPFAEVPQQQQQMELQFA